MTKRQIIDEIMSINRSAQPDFLARFSDQNLRDYLEHLRVVRTPRLSGDPRRYDAYFENCPKISFRPAGVSQAAPQAAPGKPAPPAMDASPAGESPRPGNKPSKKPFALERGSESWLF